MRRLRNIKKMNSRKLKNGQLTENARDRMYEKIEKAEQGIRAFYKRKTAEEEEKAWKNMEK